jgi:hypothetical protein
MPYLLSDSEIISLLSYLDSTVTLKVSGAQKINHLITQLKAATQESAPPRVPDVSHSYYGLESASPIPKVSHSNWPLSSAALAAPEASAGESSTNQVSDLIL